MFEKEYPNRRSVRLKGYDYSCAGGYFVTIVLQNRACLLGEVADGVMNLNSVGLMVERWWASLPRRYAASLDEFVVMPNHLHGIVLLSDEENAGAHIGQGTGTYLEERMGAHAGQEGTGAHIGEEGTGAHAGEEGTGAHIGEEGTGAHAGAPLQQIVRWFKTMTTNEYIRGIRDHGWPRFEKHLWQRNYYEHIIRDETDLVRIRRYIVNNPLSWENDEENPDRS
jgi:putative transposase